MSLTTATTVLVALGAFVILVQQILYLRSDTFTRRAPLHLATALLSFYFFALNLYTAFDSTLYIIRAGILSRLGIIVLFVLLWLYTQADNSEVRTR